MIVQNIFDTFSAPAFVFFGVPPPSADEPDFETKNAEYEKNRDAFLDLAEIKSLNDNVSLKFSLGSVVFDLVSNAINFKLFPTPESPKLMKRLDKEFMDFAQISDNDGEINVPDTWLPHIDKIVSNDDLFTQAILHGELPTENKKSMPLRSKVINTMPKLRDALLAILPA